MAQLNDLIVTGKSRFLNTISGVIETATKLGTSTVGGTTTPIYLNGGVPTALGYTIAKSVPSNAVFTDTNNAVTQTATTTDANYEVLFSATADNTTRTEGAGKTTTLRFNPSKGSLMEGYNTVANGSYSHAEGYKTTALNDYSHAEGSETYANNSASHAEGNATTAYGSYSHAEGYITNAKGNCSHAEGNATTSSGFYSHTEGHRSHAEGDCSHAEGNSTTAYGDSTHAGGSYTCAVGNSQTVIGKYNYPNTTDAFLIGGGTSSARKNIFAVNWNGTAYAAGGFQLPINPTSTEISSYPNGTMWIQT